MWQPVHPRAFRRRFRAWLVVVAAISAVLAPPLGYWTLALAALLAGWLAFVAWRQVTHLGWAGTDAVVLFRRGWIWRFTTAVPLARIQAVGRHESPFDRRHGMARVRVDTAGASEAFRVDVPYLGRDTASDLHRRLAAAAAGTAFRW